MVFLAGPDDPILCAVTCAGRPRMGGAGLERRTAIPAAVCSRWNHGGEADFHLAWKEEERDCQGKSGRRGNGGLLDGIWELGTPARFGQRPPYLAKCVLDPSTPRCCSLCVLGD